MTSTTAPVAPVAGMAATYRTTTTGPHPVHITDVTLSGLVAFTRDNGDPRYVVWTVPENISTMFTVTETNPDFDSPYVSHPMPATEIPAWVAHITADRGTVAAITPVF